MYATTVAWLQYIYINYFDEALPVVMAVILGVALVIIEWLLRLREKSQWKPERGEAQ